MLSLVCIILNDVLLTAKCVYPDFIKDHRVDDVVCEIVSGPKLPLN